MIGYLTACAVWVANWATPHLTVVIPVAIVALIAVARVLLLRRGVRQSYGDENDYAHMSQIVADVGPQSFRVMGKRFRADPRIQHKPPPQRILYLLLTGLLMAFTDDKKRDPKTRLRQKFRVLAWVSTLSGVGVVLLAGAIGWHTGGPMAGVAAGLVVGTCPLLLGLGRRALLDVPSALCQLAVVAGALLGPDRWYVVSGLTAVALLTRESTRSALPALLVAVSWLWGWNWQLGAEAIAVGLVVYAVLLKLSTGLWPWQFPTIFMAWVRRTKGRNPYSVQFCRGGLHRLIIDLVLVSPMVVLVYLLTQPTHGMALAALTGLCSYSLPWLDQQIRSAMVVDLLLRLAVALVAPWWAIALVCACDLYVYWRLWWRSWDGEGNQLYDPITVNLTRGLGMG